jgi:hypothetical protein
VSSPLTVVSHFAIPRTIIDATVDVLRAAGRKGFEAFVVWGGVVENETRLRITEHFVPSQTAHKTDEGWLVTVDGDALFEINKHLYERGQMLCGQVHSHPTDAYHSDTDDHFPLVTLIGSLSVVIPNFAAGGRESMGEWAWYRLTGRARWAELTRADKVEILRSA